MDIKKIVIRNVTFPLAMKLTGHAKRISYFKKCKKSQYFTVEKNMQEQDEKLYEIVQHAINNVPYYKKLAVEKQMKFTIETIRDDIRQFPILTKEIIRNCKDELLDKTIKDFYKETSGGSTGEPISIEHDTIIRDYAPSLYFPSYAGYEIGDKQIALWGSERDIIAGSEGWRAKISNNWIHRKVLLNSFLLNEKHMKKYAEKINMWKPKMILSYVQSMVELCEYIKRNNLTVYSPNGIIVSAGTLFPDWRKLIEDTFNCPVLNQYGSRETPGLAISCSCNSELHLNIFNHYIEIVDEDGLPLPNGQDGNIIVTSFYNKRMPLIRYQIGDIGALSEHSECACGRGMPLLKHVKGRTVNIFKTSSGSKVDGEYFTHLFYGMHEIRKFQVIQKDYEEIVINLETCSGKQLGEELEKEIVDKIRLVMGEKCHVEFIVLKEILPTKSGKFLYTISEL